MASTQGLEGVIAAETELSFIDGIKGQLVYRGFWARDLATTYSFEEVAHLLWYGHLPNKTELHQLQAKFIQHRVLPPHIAEVINLLPTNMDMMSVLRTAISAMGAEVAWPPTPAEAIRFTAMVPTIIAYRFARLQNRTPVQPHTTLSHTANYLYMLNGGHVPDPSHVRALEAYLVITMEHGLNASTFAARVVTSTQSDMASALTGAIGTMKGPLHGGAPSEVMTMLEEIGSPEMIESWLRKELDAGKRLMGFGHRLYKTRDPRAAALRSVVEHMEEKDAWFDLSVLVEDTAVRLLEEYKPGRQLYANVEYWAAAVLRATGIPKSLYTPTFTASRTVGWTAHILEQATNNRLIRPQSTYVGLMPE